MSFSSSSSPIIAERRWRHGGDCILVVRIGIGFFTVTPIARVVVVEKMVVIRFAAGIYLVRQGLQTIENLSYTGLVCNC